MLSMRKIVLGLAAAVVAFSVIAPAEATTTLIDENFASGFGVFTPSGQVGINTGNGYVACCSATGTPANMSNPFVAFGSNNLPSGTLTSPTFDFVAGETYTLDFDFAELGSGSELLNILLGSAAVITVGTPANNNLDTTFQHLHFDLTVVFGDGPGTVRITSGGADNVDSIIDNFVLTTTANLPGTPGVPEPSTWAMMLLGFTAIGFAMRRQRVAAAA